MGINRHINSSSENFEVDTVEPEVLYCVHKLQEMSNRKCELLKELNVETLEARDGDSDERPLQCKR